MRLAKFADSNQLCERGLGMRPPQGWHMSCSCDGGLAGSLAVRCFRLARLRQATAATGADSWCRLLAVGWLMLAWLGDWSWRVASLKANPRGDEGKNAAQPLWLDRPVSIWVCRPHPLGQH